MTWSTNTALRVAAGERKRWGSSPPGSSRRAGGYSSVLRLTADEVSLSFIPLSPKVHLLGHDSTCRGGHFGSGPSRSARGRPKAVFLLLACCTQEEDAGSEDGGGLLWGGERADVVVVVDGERFHFGPFLARGCRDAHIHHSSGRNRQGKSERKREWRRAGDEADETWPARACSRPGDASEGSKCPFQNAAQTRRARLSPQG